MLGLELSIKNSSSVYLAVEGRVVGDKDVLLSGTVVQVLLSGAVHRGSFLVEAGSNGENGMVIHPYYIDGQSLPIELIKEGYGRPLKTYPEIWAECRNMQSWG
ncbi:MAG: hypothetical protein WAV40_01690 [Microgenomates group bacterium]